MGKRNINAKEWIKNFKTKRTTQKVVYIIIVMLVVGAIGNVVDYISGKPSQPPHIAEPHETMEDDNHSEEDMPAMVSYLVGGELKAKQVVDDFIVNNEYGTVIINMQAPENISNNFIQSQIERESFDIARRLAMCEKCDTNRVILAYHTTLQDTNGNESYEPIFKIQFLKDRVTKINWDNVIDPKKIYEFGEIMLKHPVLN